MMKDFTRNLFYFFRGPSSDDNSVRDRQLENNLTKSLIVVLEHTDKDFLQALAEKLGLATHYESPTFSLQRKPVGVQTAYEKRIVLGITGDKTECIESCVAAEDGHPDGWILTDQWAILVESKLGSKINQDQLHRHAASAGWTRGSYDVRYLTWQNIYTIFRDKLDNLGNCSPTSCLLVREWLDYLGGQHMIPFVKLDSDDFDYFNLSEEEQRPLMSHVHERLEHFQKQLEKTEPAVRILECYGPAQEEPWKHGAPRVGERGAWFNVGGGNSAKTWHATVFFRPNGVDVEVLSAGKYGALRLAKAGVKRVSELVWLCAKNFRRPINHSRLPKGLV